MPLAPLKRFRLQLLSNDVGRIFCRAEYCILKRRCTMMSANGAIPDVDSRFHRFTCPKTFKIFSRLVEHNFHRQTLNHFNVVTGRVFRRQQRESTTCTHLKAFDMRFEIAAWKGVNFDGNGLTHFHFFEFGFLEICDYPDFRWNERKQRLPGLNVVAWFDALLRYSTVKRGKN